MDHMHLLIGLNPKSSVSETVKEYRKHLQHPMGYNSRRNQLDPGRRFGRSSRNFALGMGTRADKPFDPPGWIKGTNLYRTEQ